MGIALFTSMLEVPHVVVLPFAYLTGSYDKRSVVLC